MSGSPHQFTDNFEVEVDFMGETLRYIEGGRRTQMMWMWTNGYIVYRDTIEPWTNADKSTTPITDDERRILLERLVKYAWEIQNVRMNVE
jgi:hypothetical protein